jgi:hypothetical protein
MIAGPAGRARPAPPAGRGRAFGGLAILVAFELLGLMAGVAFASTGNVLRELALGGQVAKGARAAQAAEAGLGWFLARSGWAPSAFAPPQAPDGPGAPDLPEAPKAPEARSDRQAPDVTALLAALEGPGQGAPPGLLAEPGDTEPLGFTVQARRLGALPWIPARGAEGAASGADLGLDPDPKAAGAAGVAAGAAAGVAASGTAGVAASATTGRAASVAAGEAVGEAAEETETKATAEAALWLVTATGICGSGREAFRQVRELVVAVPPAEAPDDPDPADTLDPADPSDPRDARDAARPGAPPGRPGLWVLAWRFGD